MKVFDERAHRLMKTLVESYLLDGQPVGSKALAEKSQLSVSSATIRNVLSELEKVGLLRSPHTSAGRVPTAQGFRLFIDNLLTIEELEAPRIDELRRQLSGGGDTGLLLANASSMLSEVTRMTGIVRIPSRKITRIKQVEFLPLSDKRVLVILILDDHEVQNRMIQLDQEVSREELQVAANYVNQHFAGKELQTARDEILGQMRSERVQMDVMMKSILSMAEQGLSADESDETYHVSGRTNLVDMASQGDLTDLKSVFNAFSRKQQILALLDKCLTADGIKIFIGEETGYEDLQQCSMVGAPYSIDGKPVGVLAVVGPTRMRYDKVIPIVDITAKLLTSALNQHN